MNKKQGRDGQVSKSKIWRLIGFGAGVLIFGCGSEFGVSFSGSAHLWWRGTAPPLF